VCVVCVVCVWCVCVWCVCVCGVCVCVVGVCVCLETSKECPTPDLGCNATKKIRVFTDFLLLSH